MNEAEAKFLLEPITVSRYFVRSLQDEIKQLKERVAELEAELAKRK
jgi:hypothetical protein